MDLKKLKSKKGFTLIELMVVIVIIGILVAIALPNFISAQDRAKLASVKSNMHTFQTIAETYAVDWGGLYAGRIAAIGTGGGADLVTEANLKKYMKDFKNPFTAQSGAGLSYMPNSPAAVVETVGINAGNSANYVAGSVSYDPQLESGTITKYFMYGGDKTTGKTVLDKGIPFSLTNQ